MKNFTPEYIAVITDDTITALNESKQWLPTLWHNTFGLPVHGPKPRKWRSIQHFCDCTDDEMLIDVASIPGLQEYTTTLMNYAGKRTYGRCNISKMLPDGIIAPHTDFGKSIEGYTRYHITLLNDTNAIFTSGDEEYVAKTGQVFSFNNRVIHSVRNNGTGIRYTLAVDLK